MFSNKFSLIVFLTVGLFAFSVYSQLTFTTGWGKRNSGPMPSQLLNGNGGATIVEDTCKSSVESLLQIYKLIQMEAQRLIECSRK